MRTIRFVQHFKSLKIRVKTRLFGSICSERILESYADGVRDFRGIYLLHQSFDNVNLSGVNFSYSKIKGCSFVNTNLAGAKFEGADLGFSYRQIISFLSANRGETSKREILLIETIFDLLFIMVWIVVFLSIFLLLLPDLWIIVVCLIAIFALDFPRGLRLYNIYESENSSTSFERANLKASSFKMSNLNGCDFNYSNLDFSNLKKAKITNSCFCNASIKYTEWVDSTINNKCKFSVDPGLIELCRTRNGKQLNFEGKNLSQLRLDYVDFRQAQLNGADLSGTSLRFSLMHNSGLEKTNLIQADLSGSDLSGAYLFDADISLAKLRNANLSNAFLGSVKALRTQFLRANLTGACIGNWQVNSETSFLNVKCDCIYVDYSFQAGRRNSPIKRVPKYSNFEENEFQDIWLEYLGFSGRIFEGRYPSDDTQRKELIGFDHSRSDPNTASVADRLTSTIPISNSSNFMKRGYLHKKISELPQPQFERLQFSVRMPSSNMIDGSAAQGIRVTNLLNWAESQIGCSLEVVEFLLEEISNSP
ncbi:MAG: pentapeptide repeat-containing protein [Tildeniella torsiva UHER 1998/13D]|jgi:uncharacterized protein YjbI with pentapeptide repeats|nr:pentapeptide repeat-containing protein [Tildeniella torsiva UHER 1998/13D]